MAPTIVEVRYTRFSKRLSKRCWMLCLHRLPETLQKQIRRYRRWQDQHAVLFGRMLLLECLKEFGCSSDCLNQISTDSFGRPFLDRNIDFNISHSGEYVICAATNNARVGIDIEQIRPINLSDFDPYFNSAEREQIQTAKNGYKKFFEYWTIKESVLKGDGRGLTVSLLEVAAEDSNVRLLRNTWFLKELEIDAAYSCHLAASIDEFSMDIREIKYE